MKTLVRYLSAYVGRYVPEACPEWTLYILERKLYLIVNSSNCDVHSVAEYDCLITKHHILYQELFNEEFSPKFHLSLHYGHVMRLMGPIKYYSAMRPEGRHRFAKQSANATTSRINPTFTLAVKNQQELSQRLFQNKGLSHDLSWSSKSKLITESKDYNNFKSLIPSPFSAESVAVTWVKINGTLYETNMCVTLERGVFGRIHEILLDNQDSDHNALFIYKKLESISFSEHLQAYQVEQSNIWSCINQKHLTNYKPLVVHTNLDKQYLYLM